eukprot:TRINITY_DN1250_c0_g1_i1.p1 TRINITY_DN1250_c0_g1~~TRINITY_DN1250_c0_g1_i1.p1  ORF type:complete len:142 (+),score=52.57 TRINITY_DN1250_c0_g1_i1:106-531(+)
MAKSIRSKREKRLRTIKRNKVAKWNAKKISELHDKLQEYVGQQDAGMVIGEQPTKAIVTVEIEGEEPTTTTSTTTTTTTTTPVRSRGRSASREPTMQVEEEVTQKKDKKAKKSKKADISPEGLSKIKKKKKVKLLPMRLRK